MKVSACLIAKNEETMLPRCLNSIKDWVDEIIVVDTGSTDRTVEIAESYGAKVYHHPWENDFSLHRNQSIGYATGDWILIIDADEEIASDMSHIKERLPLLPKAVSAIVVNVTEISNDRQTTSWLGMRFFRLDSGIHYVNAVHNKAKFVGVTVGSDIQLNHYGYSLSKDKMKLKRDRTEALLQERLAKDPEDHAALYYMTQMRIGQKDYKAAIDYGIRFFKCVPVGPNDFQFYGVMYFYMSWAYLHLEDGENAYSWAKKGLEFYPDDLDLNYIMARIGYQAKMDDWLRIHADKYFERLPVVRNRNFKGDKFANPVNCDVWFNRTVYTADEAAEESIKKFMEVLV